MNHSLFIAPATSKAWFDACADQLGNGGPALMLVLSANGQAPATHGWCAVSLSEETEQQVEALIDANPDKLVVWKTYNLRTDPDFPNRLLAQLGLARVAFDPMNP